MIPQKHKFTRRYFEGIRRKMRSFRYHDFLILFKPAPKTSHFAVVISKKVAKKAVDRNRFRRQMYHLWEAHCLKPGTTVEVICLYKGAQIPENAQDLEKAVTAFLQFYTRKHQT